jgi:tripartite-type tricarboxylate transporter receptor subunit TctC
MFKVVIGAILAAIMVSGIALAQDYPTRPVTMVIPFAAGGPTDVLGRVVAVRLGEILAGC